MINCNISFCNGHCMYVQNTWAIASVFPLQWALHVCVKHMSNCKCISFAMGHCMYVQNTWSIATFSFGNGLLDVCAKHMINLQHFLWQWITACMCKTHDQNCKCIFFWQWATGCMCKTHDQFATFPFAMGHCLYVQNTWSICNISFGNGPLHVCAKHIIDCNISSRG